MSCASALICVTTPAWHAVVLAATASSDLEKNPKTKNGETAVFHWFTNMVITGIAEE